MGKHGFRKLGLCLTVSILAFTVGVQMANAVLVVENIGTWQWVSDTLVRAVAVSDVDADGSVEIVTGGDYYDGTYGNAQLCVWSGDSLKLEKIKTWHWGESTSIFSVAVGDADGDGQVEIVTGGYAHNESYYAASAQLCVWSGATLALENVKTWYWTGNTEIDSLAIGDVDGDLKPEIVTGGSFNDRWESGGIRPTAQLCVWNGRTLALEHVQAWAWEGSAGIKSVAIGHVDSDGKVEIVTGGYYYDATGSKAQLIVWNGSSLAVEGLRMWAWGYSTSIQSVAVGDVDSDLKPEIVTGGGCSSSGAQLCVWGGDSLALEDVQTWIWSNTGSGTAIDSIALGNVDGDVQMEIVTGGHFYDGESRTVAQLCVWNGPTLALEGVQAWQWKLDTSILSVGVGDVEGDSKTEIVTGGYYRDGTGINAQLCVWG